MKQRFFFAMAIFFVQLVANLVSSISAQDINSIQKQEVELDESLKDFEWLIQRFNRFTGQIGELDNIGDIAILSPRIQPSKDGKSLVIEYSIATSFGMIGMSQTRFTERFYVNGEGEYESVVTRERDRDGFLAPPITVKRPNTSPNAFFLAGRFKNSPAFHISRNANNEVFIELEFENSERDPVNVKRSLGRFPKGNARRP